MRSGDPDGGGIARDAQIRGLIAFVLVFLVLWFKLRMEEEWMRNQFGSSYDAYAKHLAALVPFVL